MKISAYIPCYNGAATLAQAIKGLQSQSRPADELFVVDNGSTDASARIAGEAGVRVVRMEHMGRGGCRARAMQEARYPLVACCDVSIMLPADFLVVAERWFRDEQVGAVCGPITQKIARGAADRWRARHLFRIGKQTTVREDAPLATGGAMVRAAAAREAGGYDGARHHGEDADLGRRLRDRGTKVIFDPALTYWQTGSNTVAQILERYWRWNRAQGRMSPADYLRQIKYSVKVMAREDMETTDIGAALISLISPHYQFWRDRRE
jgi:GT2 family glycosyltransferase